MSSIIINYYNRLIFYLLTHMVKNYLIQYIVYTITTININHLLPEVLPRDAQYQ